MTDDGMLNLCNIVACTIIPAAGYISVCTHVYKLLCLYLNVDNVGWRAAQEVFGQGLHHLLCRWHLDKYVKLSCTIPLLYQGDKCPPLKCLSMHVDVCR